ncbi:MAG: hypothetical protein ACLFU8_03590 [Anaerolineales bacterium]
MKRRRETSLRAGVALLLPVILVLLLFRRLVVGRVLADGDLQTYFFPYWVASARALQTLRLPLWNPYLFAGAPLLANSQAGVFYPLNWPLWLAAGPTLEGLTRSIHWSVLLHLGIATVTAGILARQLGVGRWGAALAGLLYAGGGFLGLHVEHLNQLQGLAWLPLALPVVKPLSPTERGLLRLVPPPPRALIALTLILLAGHTQTAFIAVTGVVLFFLSQHFFLALASSSPGARRRLFAALLRALRSAPALLPLGIAVLIAAVQLLPTFQLAQLSMRAGGLPWREAVSFSLVPWKAHQVLLPPYLVTPFLPEGVAYLGLAGLVLVGMGVWKAWCGRAPYLLALSVLALLGLFFALGGYNPLYLAAARLRLPGVIQFRAPARYLALYTLAAAVLAGAGLTEPATTKAGRFQGSPFTLHVSRLGLHTSPFLQVALVLVVFVELLLSAAHLPHADATVPRAYFDLRPATAHLVAAARVDQAAGLPASRFLSISKTLFDAGDTDEIESSYGELLSPDALWTYVVAAKDREVLAPNLPLAFAVPAADGYDGGLLPLRHYATFTRLLLPGGTVDGRLRENLEAISDERWLDLLDVRFLITDKVGDAWADGVFYDRQFRPVLEPGERLELAWLPADFAADALSLLHVGGGSVEVALEDGRALSFRLAENGGESPQRFTWEGNAAVAGTTLLAGETGLELSGAALLDTRTEAFYPLVLSERFRLAHSGDVKIYEDVQPPVRAFLVHEAFCYDAGDEAALLGSPDFDPATTVLLADCGALWRGWEVTAQRTRLVPFGASPPAAAEEGVRVIRYEPSRVELEVRAAAEAFLVLKDAWYPGWTVTVAPLDGGAVPPPFPRGTVPLRADVLLRAVPIPSGTWRVVLTYRPTLLYVGAGLSLLGCLIWLGYAVRWRRRDSAAPI